MATCFCTGACMRGEGCGAFRPVQPFMKPLLGWECPKCGNIYAPGLLECINCNSLEKSE